ncbi:hypothetical protein EWB00_010164 [Schistosoma japonicum]|uniref:Uncharacterized protein n=1 Tax=Schistosoma japonicum TaxID=6182 RepID=A0A4Z2CKZ9_SCHJA|nr:Retrovirus Pol polyprotein from transposon opus [Schistosoma japonicum]KAH8850262.1 Retrovirus Pol polyprotein from transposon opus [Schistosoma japonicum]KAH8850263.1 Retrovirus Pol polyprotein from transposon opus [Schistosoma japonicum]KAH8850264.1 Retrovirus Pol polyprotein from transposon opus [Schistosoma japonicum]KAH8850265.1 Retrovirus Pol polyprotein from transposon opus [Schistosoma japonicum]
MTFNSATEKLFHHLNIDTKQWSYSRITVAVLSHESLGIGLLVGFWIICYKKQPIKHLMLSSPVNIQNVYSKGLSWSAKKLDRLPLWISSRVDPNRILVSGAESYVLRKILSPITIPGKIYLAVLISGLIC